MPPDTPIPGSSEDWLRHARSDLALARQVSPDVLLATLCFHIQQAVEKSVKAVLVQQGTVFPYTHDLAQLITRVKDTGSLWPESLDAAAALTVYAAGRYQARPAAVHTARTGMLPYKFHDKIEM